MLQPPRTCCSKVSRLLETTFLKDFSSASDSDWDNIPRIYMTEDTSNQAMSKQLANLRLVFFAPYSVSFSFSAVPKPYKVYSACASRQKIVAWYHTFLCTRRVEFQTRQNRLKEFPHTNNIRMLGPIL